MTSTELVNQSTSIVDIETFFEIAQEIEIRILNDGSVVFADLASSVMCIAEDLDPEHESLAVRRALGLA